MHLFVVGICLVAQLAYSETNDAKILEQALAQTQALLQDPVQRSQAVQKDPKAQAADAQLQSLMGTPEATAKAYKVASEILGLLVQQYGGDTEKMAAALQQASQNPAAFMSSLPAEQQAKIRMLASELESRKPKQ